MENIQYDTCDEDDKYKLKEHSYSEKVIDRKLEEYKLKFIKLEEQQSTLKSKVADLTDE